MLASRSPSSMPKKNELSLPIEVGEGLTDADFVVATWHDDVAWTTAVTVGTPAHKRRRAPDSMFVRLFED